MNPKDTEHLALSQRACVVILRGASQFFTSWRWFAPARTRGDTDQLALTRRVGIQARGR